MLEAEQDAATQVDPNFSANRPANILIAWAGTNDLVLGANVATTQTRITTYCTNRRAVGWKVIIGTILPRDFGGTFEADRQTVNTWIRANWATFADGMADFAADARIGDAGDNFDLTYYLNDFIHMNGNGYNVIAGIVRTAMQPLL
jgi:lysophospholipase L1-like esterase